MRSARLRLLGLVAVFVALSVYATVTSEPGVYVPDDQLEQVVEPKRYLEREVYLWDDARSLGKPTSPFSFGPVPAAFQAGLEFLGAAPWLIERLTHALYFVLAALGVILLLREFRPRLGPEHAIAGFVYAFSPFTTQFLFPSGLFLYYALAPWFAWFALRGIRDRDPWRWAAAFALAAAATGATNVPALCFALVPAAIVALYLWLSERVGTRRLAGWVWRAGVLSLLTCSAAIVVVLYAGPEVSANLRTTELPETVSRTSSWSESWRGLGLWLTYFLELRSSATAYLTSADVIVATFLLPIGALIALALGRWRHRLLFGALILVSLVLMVGAHHAQGSSPFSELLSFTFDHWAIAHSFRNTYKAGPGLMIGISVLLGIGVASAIGIPLRKLNERGTRGRIGALPVGLAVLGPVAVAAVLFVASAPFWTDRLYPDDEGYRAAPTYWDEALDRLAEAPKPGRVLVLPGSGATYYRWGEVHEGFFGGLSPLSPLVDRQLPQGTAESADLVSAIDDYVSSPGYVKGTLGPMLSRLGVRWVLLQNDLDWQRMDVPRPATFGGIRNDPGLRRVAGFGRRGKNTTAEEDLGGALLGEDSLRPVELYEVKGEPSPRPRLVTDSLPLLVAGAGDSWPALAAAGLLERSPIAYTGAAADDVLSTMVTSGSRVVVTDGNRRRLEAATIEHPYESPTLAEGESHDRPPADLFDRPGSQSLATYADASSITATRYGAPVRPYEAASRPANAFDGLERTSWRVRGPLDPDGEALTVKLKEPTDVTSISVLPHSDGPWRVRTVDLTLLTEDGGETTRRLEFRGLPDERPRARIEVDGVTEIELRIVTVDGPGPVEGAGVGIGEVEVGTPEGPLDLREFVRTPDDLAIRAEADDALAAHLAVQPPRYEFRRLAGIGAEDEETELRRELTAFGDNRYRLNSTATVNLRTPDGSIDALLGAQVGAVGSSRLGGDPARSGRFAVDDDLSTAWEPELLPGQKVDLRFPETDVSSVEVVVLSGSPPRLGPSRVTEVEVAVGEDRNESARSRLPAEQQCESESPLGRCLETHVVQLPTTRANNLSVALTRIKAAPAIFGLAPPTVVEVRVNGSSWGALAAPGSGGSCAPLFAVDGRPVPVRLPSNPEDLLRGRERELKGCGPIRLGPGEHRFEALPSLSGATHITSLVPQNEGPLPAPRPSSAGEVELVERSPTQLDLDLEAPSGALLIGGMPADDGWVADDDQLRRSPVPLDTFSAWTVDAPTDRRVTLRFSPQGIFELALALSIASAAWCLWRVTRRRPRP